MAQQPSVGPFVDYLKTLQDSIVAALEAADGEATFLREEIATDGGGLSRPRVLADGPVIEKAAVQFTHSVGKALPPAATERHPHLAGRGFQAGAVSLIVHPRNPYAPTTHMNIRMFVVDGAVDEPGAWYPIRGMKVKSGRFSGSKTSTIAWIERPQLIATFTRGFRWLRKL